MLSQPVRKQPKRNNGTATFSIKLGNLKRFADTLKNDLRTVSNGPIRQAFNDWVSIYQTFLYNRYITNSRGGGDWQPLAESTIRKKGHSLILIETEFLLQNFNPSFRKPSQLSAQIPFGIRVQVPNTQHPTANTSIYNLMSWHHNGSARLPVRKIVVPPTRAVQAQMRERMKKALQGMGARVK